ncbi:MAG: DNA primase [Planctomycetota bacterium]|nr:DNA primase [Planctomycetota bacterium]MDI6787148.1 DNA primase [Planctomycetota bacterium]
MEHFIPHSQIVEIQQATDIVELISDYIPLKKTGQNYRALCPFHEEKTPSFTVNPNKQIFHCFGCHKGGNVFSFVMAYEKVEFPQAVRTLAQRSGIKLINERTKDDAGREKRTELLKVNRLVTDYYHRFLLNSDENSLCMAYLKKRGFTTGLISRFLLGWAPPGWDNLLNYAKDKNISLRYLEELGLIIERKEKDGYYDRFRNRLIFPIFNSRGGVVGFGGRALDENDQPVYLNSPENILFSKGKSLYGINFARESCGKIGMLCLVEGYTDVIMAHQNGFEWVVATLGTALTIEHIKLLRRFVNKVIVVYDADVAGEMASARSLDLFLAEEMDLFVATLPEGLDPYDCLVQKNGKEIFQKCLDEVVELFTYRLELARRKYNLNNIEEKTKAIDEILETIAAVPNIVKRNLYIKQLSETMRISEDILRNRLKVKTKNYRTSTDVSSPDSSVAILPSQQQDIRGGEQIIEIMLTRNEFIPIIRDSVDIKDYPTEESRKLAEKIFENYKEEGKVTIENLLNYLGSDLELSGIATRIFSGAVNKNINDYDRYLRECLGYIERRRRRMVESPHLKKQLKEAQLKGDNKAVDSILSRLQRGVSVK